MWEARHFLLACMVDPGAKRLRLAVSFNEKLKHVGHELSSFGHEVEDQWLPSQQSALKRPELALNAKVLVEPAAFGSHPQPYCLLKLCM